MGIFCEINLFKPSDEAYEPGQSVRGLIKYAVDESMTFNKITTSLKGRGHIHVVKESSNNSSKTYKNSEVCIDVDVVVQDEKELVAIGAYYMKFSFVLPYNIPPSTCIHKSLGSYTLDCKIKYYIRIKFERPGIFAPNKHFRKEIAVLSTIPLRLLREPIMYGEKKKPIQIFSNKNGAINIKATIHNSVIPIAGKIEIHYKAENNSSIQVKSVKAKLIEVYKFLSKKEASNFDLPEKDVPNTDISILTVQCGDAQIMPIKISIPPGINSLEHSKIILRWYQVRLETILPIPHKNIILNIPVQIGKLDEISEDNNLEETNEEMAFDNPPPSYWEAMGETEKLDDNVKLN